MVSESKSEIELAKCECCGMTDEYTAAYIENVRKLYAGKWICGLCSEAVKYEMFRRVRQRGGGGGGGVTGVEEALAEHMRSYGEFRSSSAAAAADPTVGLISAFMPIFRRRILDSQTQRRVRSAPANPVTNCGGFGGGGGAVYSAVLDRTESCLPTLSGGA